MTDRLRPQTTPNRFSSTDPLEDTPRALRDMRRAVQDCLQEHKRAGLPVAVWRNGRVEWVPADEIPDPPQTGDE